jgi:hypothetical protein
MGTAAPKERDRMASFRQWVERERVSNKIDLAPLAEFWKNWSLVNVRYRKDNDEQRFIYANDIAWKALQENKTVYPENAMFVKAAFRQKADPAFPNSMQPQELIRVQIMKKSPRDFPDSEGWGYALFLPLAPHPGKQAPDLAIDDVKDQRVCHVCHTIVKDRDYVFSQPAFFETPELDSKRYAVEFHDKFETKRVSELSKYARDIIHVAVGDSHETVKVYSMLLFPGSLDESTGPLVEYAARDSAVFLLIDENRKQFLLSYPGEHVEGCRTLAYSVKPLFPTRVGKWQLHRDQYCDGKGKDRKNVPLPPELVPPGPEK